jgi:hypothetical protein
VNSSVYYSHKSVHYSINDHTRGNIYSVYSFIQLINDHTLGNMYSVYTFIQLIIPAMNNVNINMLRLDQYT